MRSEVSSDILGAVTDDPVTERAHDLVDVVLAGHRKDGLTARRALRSADPKMRELAIGALARAGALDGPTLASVVEGDTSPAVRRRACDVAATRPADRPVLTALRRALADPDALVVEAACWSLGELRAADVVGELSGVASAHPDARAREAAVAALGAIGDPSGLAAVLGALEDRPTIRRRAVVALAAFDGAEVADALRRSAGDRDWQVREVAEILLDE
jgi:HEAT repeat protein